MKAAVIAALISAYGFVGAMDAKDEAKETIRYCEMVSVYVKTNGQAGWPAYRKEIDCGDQH